MSIRIAINGFGRIGRCVVRALFEHPRDDITLVAVNGPAPIETHMHLLKYDSVHGVFPHVRRVDDVTLDAGFGPFALLGERDPSVLPWKELGVDVVLECSGAFTERAKAAKHLDAGAKRVLISAPSPDADATIVYGVNQGVLDASKQVISVGSCTTNCLAPVAKVLNDAIGIEHGFMTTIHAYTNDQNIMDGSHKDLRRARAAALSMIPTSTGAAKALGLVLPEMIGKLDGVAVRVPTPNVSMVDLTFVSGRDTSKDEINALLKAASESAPLKGVLGFSEEPLVSIDFNHTTFSSVFDATGTKVVNRRFCRVASWYDNEWAFSLRMLDLVQHLKGALAS